MKVFCKKNNRLDINFLIRFISFGVFTIVTTNCPIPRSWAGDLARQVRPLHRSRLKSFFTWTQNCAGLTTLVICASFCTCLARWAGVWRLAEGPLGDASETSRNFARRNGGPLKTKFLYQPIGGGPGEGHVGWRKGYLRYHLRSWQTTGLIKSLRPFYKKSLSNMPVSLQTQSGPIGPPDWNSSAKDLCDRNGKQAGQLRPDRAGEIPLKIESGFNSSKKCSENRLWLVAM